MMLRTSFVGNVTTRYGATTLIAHTHTPWPSSYQFLSATMCVAADTSAGLSLRTRSIFLLGRSPILTLIHVWVRQRSDWGWAIKPVGDKDMVPMLFVRWWAICSRFHRLHVSMQRRLWLIAQPGVPLPKPVLSKSVKFSIPVALANHGYCWKYTDQMRHNICRL